MSRLLVLLLVAASASASAEPVVLTKAFTPNPLIVSVPRAEKIVIEVPEGVSHLVVQAAFGELVGGEKSLSLEVKQPGPIEVTVSGSSPTVKLRIFDADRPRLLPDAVKTVVAGTKPTIELSGEVTGGAVPDAQLEVTSEVKWKLQGTANEVWLTPLALEDAPAVKAGSTLAPGRYAVWIRGEPGTYSLALSAVMPVAAESTLALDESNPKVKAFLKLKTRIQGCIDRHPDWPDAAKRCNFDKVTKAQAKLEADLKKKKGTVPLRTASSD